MTEEKEAQYKAQIEQLQDDIKKLKTAITGSAYKDSDYLEIKDYVIIAEMTLRSFKRTAEENEKLRQQLPEVIKFKPLEWTEASPNTFVANSVFGLWSYWGGAYKPPEHGLGTLSDNQKQDAERVYIKRLKSTLK